MGAIARIVPSVRLVSLLVLLAVAAAASPALAQGDPRLVRARALVDEAWADIQAGRFAESLPKSRESLELREQALGPMHPQLAFALHPLARGYQELGDYGKARPLIERAILIRERALKPNDPLLAVSYYHLGVVLNLSADYRGGLAAYQRALAIREQALGPDHRDTALTLNVVAWTYQQLGDYAAARPLYERALAIRERTLGPTHPDVAQTLDDYASLLRAVDDLAAARPLVERALRIREAAFGPDHERVAQSLYNLGTTLYMGGDYMAARAPFERSLAIRERLLGPEHPQVGRALSRLAMTNAILGDYAQGRQRQERGLAILDKALGPNHPDVTWALNNLGLILRWQGDLAGSRAALERALATNERTLGPEHLQVAQTLYVLALVEESSGNYAAARRLDERALAIREKSLGPEHSDVALCVSLLASLRMSAGDFKGAIPFYERALRIYEKSVGPEHRNFGLALSGLANAYRRTGDPRRAGQTLERALAIQERALGPEHPEVGWALNNLGYVRLDLRDFAGAATFFNRALAISRKATAPDLGWRVNFGLGRVSEIGRKWPDALGYYREAVKLLETQASQFTDETQRTQFLQAGNRMVPYDALARVLLKLYETDQGSGYEREAWAVLDAKKKRMTAEMLSAARPTLQDPKARAEMDIAQTKLDERVALERTLREERAKAAAKQQPEMIRSLTTQLAQTKAEYLAQVQRFLAQYPQYKSQFVDQQTVDPKALAKFADRLPADTLAVQYFAAPERLYLFVVGSGGRFQVKTRDVAQADLFRLVKQYRELVERGVSERLPWADDGSEIYRKDVAPLKAATEELSAHLLRPIEAELRASQGLVVIPNDMLLYLPIHALTREGGRFLAETHAVSYVTQLELSDLIGGTKGTVDAPLLAIANPDGTLPAASREVRALTSIRPRVTTLEGAKATKASFLSEAGHFADLHLATHGVLDAERPERSYLLLAGVDDASSRLRIDEIAGLSLPSGLTILSACETAVGEQMPGAALITLAAAFSQAGSQSIVASLWRVNDAATRDFMVDFHGHLAGGRAAALRHAQTTLLAKPATAHPFYWAAFVLIGAR